MSATSWKPDSNTYGLYMKSHPDIRKMGYLKKLKTMKRKFFILREDTGEEPAKLEYYDSEKKWRAGANPKRSIVLKTCFNISRKLDTRHKHAIALYTKDDCFTIVLDNDSELDEWLQALLELQHGKEAMDDEIIKPTFEHVWQVNVKSKGIVSTKSISGPHRLCLTAKVLTLVRMNMDNPDIKEFPLSSIRRCGHSDCFFFMELGRSAVTGAGELWMQTEDMIIAQNMHEAILSAMRSSAKEDIVPRQRTRSSSANESSKPINVHSRRQTAANLSATISTSTPSSRDRCDSMPSRPRTISEGQPYGSTWERFHYSSLIKPSYLPNLETHRPHSMYTHPSHSLPTTSLLPSPGSTQYTTDSCGSSLSMDEHDSSQMDLFLMKFNYSQTPDSNHPSKSPITEEVLNMEDYVSMSPTELPKRNSEIWESVQEEDYMRMASPISTSLSSPQSIPGASSSGMVSAVIHSRTPSLTNPPSLLAIGLSSVKACSPPTHEGDYLNMTSPAASSPSDLDGYLPMSPLGTSFPDIPMKPPTPVKSFVTASPTNSGTKKNSKDIGDGYVPMAPVSVSKKNSVDSEGYMDMTPTAHSSKNGKGNPYLDMSPTSTTIPKSGTPSTDIRFSEYQLEKVQAYFTPSEDDDERLVRAYSFGSKPDSTNRRRSGHLDVFNSDTRTRAFSVGSKVSMQFGKLSSGIGGSASPNPASVDKSKKSSSAPLLGGSKLSSSWSGTSAFFKTYTNSKPNYSEDLMEIDFGNRTQSGRSSDSGGKRSNNSSVESLPRSGRPRSNSKSSSSRSAKHDTLQVIGEKSDIFVPSCELVSQRSPSFEEDYMEFPQFSKSKNVMGRDDGARLSFRKKDINSNVPFDTSCLLSKLETSKPISSEDYVEMDGKTDKKLVLSAGKEQEPTKLQPLKVQVSFPTKDVGSSPPSSGEYVNIDLGKRYQKMPVSSPGVVLNSLGISFRCRNSKTMSSEGTTIDSKTSKPPIVIADHQFSQNFSKPTPNISPTPDYMNLQIGSYKTNSKLSNVPEPVKLSQGAQKIEEKIDKDNPSLEAETKPGPLKTLQSISRMQKQLSAPTIMSTILSKGGPFSSQRKISMPATLSGVSSSTVVESSVCLEPPSISAAPSSSGIQRLSSPSSNGNGKTSAENVLPLVKSTTKEGSKAIDPAIAAEKPYENVCIGKDSKSRPTSVSSERELNYASLDLSPLTISTAAAPSEEEKLPVSPRVTVSQTVTTSTEEVVEESAGPNQFSYAEIDFTKSEGLRNTSNTVREIRQ